MLHHVDPSLLPGLELMQGFELTAESLPAIRAGMAEMAAAVPEPEGTGTTWRDDAAPSPEGHAVPLRVYTPARAAGSSGLLPAVVQIHGGGYVMGSHQLSHAANMVMAAEVGAVVVSVDYRLAPENPFPAAHEDCLAAYDWLLAHADALDVDPARIVISGESAGGLLAAALAHMIRDTGRPLPAAQILTYPMLDHRTGTDEMPAVPYTGEFIWTPELNRYAWGALRGSYAFDDHRVGWFSPSHAADLAGLPPTWLALGALDLFLAEDLDYARRLVAAGVPVELHVYPGCIHAFNMVPGARMAEAYNRDLRSALGAFLKV